MQPANPVNPQRVAWELSPRLPDRVILTSDSGSCANWYARDLKIRRGMMASLSGGLASMGAAVPYAIAAKFAHPDRPVIALVGDGAMQMNNMAELITVAKYWRRVGRPALDRLRVQQRGSQPGHLGAAGDGGRSEVRCLAADSQRALSPLRRADRARRASLSIDPTRLGAAWDEALAADRPVVLEVKTDPEVPPLPPHITFEQAKHFAETLIKGDPHEGGVIMGAARQVLASIIPAK